MFNFKKKKLIKDEDYTFLSIIADKLSSQYPYLLDQVSKEFILDKKPNPLGDEGTYTLSLNAQLESKYSNKSLPQFFILRDISVWNNLRKRFDQVELHILEGMLAGFKVTAKYSDLNLSKVDVTKVKEKHFKNEDKDFLKRILGDISKDVSVKLDIEGTFKINLPEGEFYVIKDLKDGNYLAVDEKGAVYGMIHDPYEIEKIFDNKETFFEALESRIFSIPDYIDKKMG